MALHLQNHHWEGDRDTPVAAEERNVVWMEDCGA